MTDLRYGPMPPSAEMYALAQARAKRILEGSRIAPPTVTCRCGVTTDTPASTGWHWSAVQEAWSCPQCGVEPTPESYARGYALGVAYEHAGILEPEGGFPEDPLFTRGIAHGRADYRERVGSLMVGR